MPACTHPQSGAASPFGLESDEAGMVSQSVKVTNKRDKKELKNSCGETVGVTYYNKTTEVEVTGILAGGTAKLPGDPFDLINSGPGVSAVSTLYVDEVSVDLSNEDFPKISIKATAWEEVE